MSNTPGSILSFTTFLHSSISALISTDHIFNTTAGAASVVASASSSGISTFRSDWLSLAVSDLDAVFTFVIAVKSISILTVSIHLRNCSGLAGEWTIAIKAFTASSPCYWLTAHYVIFWTNVRWINSIKLISKWILLLLIWIWNLFQLNFVRPRIEMSCTMSFLICVLHLFHNWQRSHTNSLLNPMFFKVSVIITVNLLQRSQLIISWHCLLFLYLRKLVSPLHIIVILIDFFIFINIGINISFAVINVVLTRHYVLVALSMV